MKLYTYSTIASIGMLMCFSSTALAQEAKPEIKLKAIVPDEPLDLPPNQALILRIQAVGGKEVQAEDSSLAWIAEHAVDSEALPVDLADRHDRYLYGRESGNDRQ